MSRRLLTFGETQDRVGLSRSHLSRLVSAGSFPVPVEVAPRRVAFVEAEVEAWIEARIAERDTPEARRTREARSSQFRDIVNKRWAKARASESAEA